MAGQPKLRALRARLTEAARAASATSAEAYVFARIADGELLSTLCRELGCNRSLLYVWINKTDERREAFRQARALAADSHADEAVTIADGADPETIGVARLRAELRRWLAQSFNREQYSANAPVTVQAVSIGQAHLLTAGMPDDALRRLLGTDKPALPAAPDPQADDAEHGEQDAPGGAETHTGEGPAPRGDG